jgi:hypothetical protein
MAEDLEDVKKSDFHLLARPVHVNQQAGDCSDRQTKLTGISVHYFCYSGAYLFA